MKKLTGNRMNTTPDRNAYSPEVIQEWYNKLWEYENTGFDPEEINKDDINHRKFIDVTPNEDGEYWCPACNAEIAGYYASYCEHCGQAINREYED